MAPARHSIFLCPDSGVRWLPAFWVTKRPSYQQIFLVWSKPSKLQHLCHHPRRNFLVGCHQLLGIWMHIVRMWRQPVWELQQLVITLLYIVGAEDGWGSGLECVGTIHQDIAVTYRQCRERHPYITLLTAGSWTGSYRFTGSTPTTRVPPLKWAAFFSDLAFLKSGQANWQCSSIPGGTYLVTENGVPCRA